MKKYEKHEIHEAVTHLLNAHDVMKDPDLMKQVQEKMKGVTKIKTIKDLKEAASLSQKEDHVEDDGDFESLTTEDMENKGMDPLGNYGEEKPNTHEGATTIMGKKHKSTSHK